MSSAEGSNLQNFLQRASTPLFLFLALLFVPAATLVSVIVGMIVCVIAGIENSDLQARIGLAALLIGFVGSIYLLIRARRSPVLRPQQALARRRAIEQLEVGRIQALQEAEIASREEVERARIASDRGLDEARIGRERDLRKLEVNREKEVETALMEKAIALYQKSLEESAAKVAAEDARAGATEAAERVVTARDSEIAKRQKTIEVLLAEKRAEETKIAADAERVRAAVEAEAQRLLNEAENVLTDQARYSLFRRKLLDRIEGIVRESVKPMEKIEGIRILQVDGLNGGGGGNNGGRSATDEVIDSALRYRVQAPLIDSILADIGVEGGSLARMPGLIREARDMQGIKESARKGGQEKPGGRADAPPAAPGEPGAERGPRKKG